MTYDEIKNALYIWITGNADAAVQEVIFARQNAPRPDSPYITIFVETTDEDEHANESAPNSDGDAVIENNTTVSASIQCFGENSKSILDGLKLSLNKVTVRQALRAAGLPYIQTLNGVSDLTDTEATQFEERAGMDLEFRTISAVTDNVGVIESVEVTGTNDTALNTYENNYQIGVN